MTPEEENPKVHHQTARGARLALARKEINREGYRAVLAGELSLEEARKLGREGGPGTSTGRGGSGAATETPRSVSAEDGADTSSQPVSRISKDDRRRECMCGRITRGRFAPGHDVRLVTFAKE